MYQVYDICLGQTEAVLESLKSKTEDDAELVYEAAGLICTQVVCDAISGVELAKQYCEIVEDVLVLAYARRSGNTIYVTITHFDFDGDWDPDGGEGLDHVAFARVHEVARAIATLLGRHLSFQQSSGRPIPFLSKSVRIKRRERLELARVRPGAPEGLVGIPCTSLTDRDQHRVINAFEISKRPCRMAESEIVTRLTTGAPRTSTGAPLPKWHPPSGKTPSTPITVRAGFDCPTWPLPAMEGSKRGRLDARHCEAFRQHAKAAAEQPDAQLVT